MAYRVLIIGVGSIGERHLRCFKATGRAEAGLVEINPALRDAIAKRYEVAEAFASLDAGITGKFDAAVVCTPAQLHVAMTRQFVEAGMHVLVEKPLSTNMEGISELKALVAKKQAVVSVGYVWRASPILAAMRNAIREGRFGTPVEAVVVTGSHFPTFRPAYRAIYYNHRNTGGGAIQDALTHMINAVEWLIGPVDRLACDVAHQVLDGVTVEDTAHLLTRHGSVLASYALNQHQAPTEVSITIVCDKGTVRFEPMQHRWRWMTEPNSTWHDETFPAAERDAMYIAQAHAFLDAVEGKCPVACTLEQGAQTLRVNLAALASADAGALQPLP
jgi:predicted dehydrogenase